MSRQCRLTHPAEDLPAEATPRRVFLSDLGMGFTGLALGAMLFRDGIAQGADDEQWSPPSGQPLFAPRSKSIICNCYCLKTSACQDNIIQHILSSLYRHVAKVELKMPCDVQHVVIGLPLLLDPTTTRAQRSRRSRSAPA